MSTSTDATTTTPAVDMPSYVAGCEAAGELVVQPRMGMAGPASMADGLRAVADIDASTLGTITLDSFTRIGDHASAAEALAGGADLNGFPIVAHGSAVTSSVVDGVRDRIPVQVRHGSPYPGRFFEVMTEAGLTASEGGPVSYCLPYGRTPLAESVAAWRDATTQLAESAVRAGGRAHLETFGGCLLGQLCPPSLLVAMSVLEAAFFAQHGVRSVSLSYAQQTDMVQDVEALTALHHLADAVLSPEVDRHVVVYTYMGMFPRTRAGARRLLERSAETAVRGGAQRLIVKTEVEASRIPTVEENVTALQVADTRARKAMGVTGGPTRETVDCTEILQEASAIVAAVLDGGHDVGESLRLAFAGGLLDVPYCLHQDNRGRTRTVIDDHGRLRWAAVGGLPIAPAEPTVTVDVGAGAAHQLMTMLHHTATEQDALAARPTPPALTHDRRSATGKEIGAGYV